MKNGYRIRWTDNALKELGETITFLETHWTEKELRKLSNINPSYSSYSNGTGTTKTKPSAVPIVL